MHVVGVAAMEFLESFVNLYTKFIKIGEDFEIFESLNEFLKACVNYIVRKFVNSKKLEKSLRNLLKLLKIMQTLTSCQTCISLHYF